MTGIIDKIKKIERKKLPEAFQNAYDDLKDATNNFDAEMVAIYADELKEFHKVVSKKQPQAVKGKAPSKKPSKKKPSPKAKKREPQKAESIKDLISKLKKEPRYKGKLSDSTYPPNSSRSLKKDSKQVALPPGKRISKKTGEAYYEGRMNRADIDKTIRLEKGGSLSGANYIPAYEVEKIVMKSGKVIDLMSDPLTLVSGVRYTPTGSAFTSKIAQNQLALFGFGGKLSDKAKYYTREEIDHVVTDHAGIIQGNQIYNGMWLESDMISDRQKMLLDQYVESQKRRKGLEVDVVVRKTDKDPWEFIKKDISRDEAEKIVAKAKKSGKYHAVMINDLPFGAGGVLAGTIIGAYLGYKVGRSQEKSDDVFKTEKKAVSKAKAKVKEHRARKKVPAMAKGGEIGNYEAIYNGKKISITASSLYEAKTKAIKELKVPKSKQGLLSVYSKKSMEQGDFRFLAKGGKVDKWIQKADKEMEKEGTVGAFTKQAKRVGMTPVAFAKKVLDNSKDYTKRTRERAQFVKNTNPEKFKGGGSTYADGGAIKKERKYTSKQDHEQKYKSKRKSPVVSYKKAPKEEEEHGDGWGIDFLNLFN